MKKQFPDKNANPNPKPTPHRPEEQPSTDSRDWHGLSEDEALRGKK